LPHPAVPVAGVERVFRSEASKTLNELDPDPVQTEIIRHGLTSIAEQMKRALVRTAFSPIIYEAYDFAVALYDNRVRLLGQALGLPQFMGTLGFCIEAAVCEAGGETSLAPGDILLYNIPYGSGAHPQDVATVMPVFVDDDLVGYSVAKGHWLDIGGKEPYATDTTDVFQEGTLLPGVRLYSGGVLSEDVKRLVAANSRVPEIVLGDVEAGVISVKLGATELERMIKRFGKTDFMAAVDRMFDHSERLVRSYFEAIPDGEYSARGALDNNGRDQEAVEFDLRVEIKGSTVIIDYTAAPDTQAGPLNSPAPATVASTRVAIMMLVGAGEAPNEGHFRPIEVRIREGSMFDPKPPAPCFLAGWADGHAIEVIYRALATVVPEAVPAGSGGDALAVIWWGQREATGETWIGGGPHPLGQGASAFGDGASGVMYVSQTATRLTPVEVWEANYPWLLESVELAQDSAGAGRFRGGLGVDFVFELLEDAYVTSVVERTRNTPWGLEGGREARSNSVTVTYPDGNERRFGKVTGLRVPKGTKVKLATGGGGGYGLPADRDRRAIQSDIADGYISPQEARAAYPHAFDERALTIPPSAEGDAGQAC